MFIWDGNLLIDVDCNNVGKSVVVNSALTTELGRVSSTNYSLNVEPLKILNKEVDDCIQRNRLSNLNPCKEVKDRRDKFSRESQDNFEKYIIKYVKSNPDSFVSLYFLTYGGPTLGVEPEYIDAFKSLSPRLKSHRKAKMYDGIR